MNVNRLSTSEWIERIVLALLFTTVGSYMMIVFNPWRPEPMLSRTEDYLAKIGSSILLLVVALLARRSKRFEKFWQILFAMFTMSVVVSLDLIFGIYRSYYLGIIGNSAFGFAFEKLNECFVVVSVIITFTFLAGGSLGSIYIQKGNLKLGLIIGLTAFIVMVASSFPVSNLLFNAKDLSLTRAIPWIPWLLILALANGTIEELWFRGLFLRKLQPFFGKFISIFLIAIVFTLLHGLATYTSNNAIFLVIVFPLALAWGYIMHKTDSIWGSILFHASMDIPIFLGYLSRMP